MAPPPHAPASLDLQLDVETPEQVAFSYTIAGVGSRAAAAMVDTLLCVVLFALLGWLVSLAVHVAGGDVSRAGTVWGTTLLVLGQFAIFWGWYVLWEGLNDGQTPGKRLFRLRVVRDGGFAVDFAASAARNLVRVLDMQPGVLYGVGAAAVAASPSGKRLGDLVAGTIVVRERVAAIAAPPPADRPRSGRDADAVERRVPLTTLLTDDEYALLARFRERRGQMHPARAAAFVAQLAVRLRPRAPELAPGANDAAFLARLHEHERLARAAGAAARGDAGAARAHHRIVAEGRERWAEFARRLAEAQQRGLQRMGEEEVSEFVARYRELTTDLARLRTAERGGDSDAVYRLSRLVAGGHNLLYRGGRLRAGRVWRFVAVGIPAELRRSWGPIALSALLLLGPAVAAFEAVRRSPTAAAQLVSPEMVDRAETGLERRRTGGGYLPEEMMQARGPMLASMIATNNIQIAFYAFAGGVTAGVLTILSLVFNGALAIGAPLGYYARLGLLDQILGFVAPHGLLELVAICVAGAAGLHLAAAILLPGALTRREALVVRGRRALTLVAGATVMLVVAGLLEGYVSPLVFPLRQKLWITAATGVALVAWWGVSAQRSARSDQRNGLEPASTGQSEGVTLTADR
ncbi:MAG TPA: stage II sporulation protein M [Gemmatimonadaceae bacterium]|nr:stage II sporulation protein M [Gemmatimonadaceae bacterium]